MTDEVKVKVKPAERPAIMIATPMYGGMCTGRFTRSLLRAVIRLRAMEIGVYWAHMVNESLITRGRNELARLFLEKNYSHLMFIDADIAFEDDAILHLLKADKDVVCGIYPKKEVNWESVKRAADAGRDDLSDYAGSFVFNTLGESKETNEDGVFEMRHGGTGFMLIKRGVFEHLAPHVPVYRASGVLGEDGQPLKPLTREFFATSIDKNGVLLSEDYHFCELVRAHGGEIWGHPFLKLTHTGTYDFGGDILKSGGNLK